MQKPDILFARKRLDTVGRIFSADSSDDIAVYSSEIYRGIHLAYSNWLSRSDSQPGDMKPTPHYLYLL
jgi:hypothetical protein